MLQTNYDLTQDIVRVMGGMLLYFAHVLAVDPGPLKRFLQDQTVGPNDSEIIKAVLFGEAFVHQLYPSKGPPPGSLGEELITWADKIRRTVTGLNDQQSESLAEHGWKQELKSRCKMDDRCDACNRTAIEAGRSSGKLMRCSRCKVAMYCSEACSKKDWKQGRHRTVCFNAAEG